jgi:hypothetical protein
MFDYMKTSGFACSLVMVRSCTADSCSNTTVSPSLLRNCNASPRFTNCYIMPLTNYSDVPLY